MLIVEFESGHEHAISDERCLEVFHSNPDDEWWTEITQCGNPYDGEDTPVAVITPDMGRIPLDDDGLWMETFERSSIWGTD